MGNMQMFAGYGGRYWYLEGWYWKAWLITPVTNWLYMKQSSLDKDGDSIHKQISRRSPRKETDSLSMQAAYCEFRFRNLYRKHRGKALELSNISERESYTAFTFQTQGFKPQVPILVTSTHIQTIVKSVWCTIPLEGMSKTCPVFP